MRNWKMAAIGTIVSALIAGAAGAASYDVAADFGNPVFSYGGGTPGAGFAATTSFMADGCLGTTGLACYYTPNTSYNFPAIAKNISNSDPITFYTNVLPKNELFLQTNPGTDAILRFTAATTGRYRFTGAFERIDNANGAGDGVTVGVLGGGFSDTKVLANSRAGAASSYTLDISRTILLNAGQSVDFYQNANTNVNNDGTGLRLTVAAIPEASSWAMMVVGFGAVGGAMRRRQRSVARFA